MRLTEENLRAVFRQQTARSTPRQAECLTAEEFVTVADGSMSRSERHRVAQHFIVCADCTEEYRILRSLAPWAEEAGGLMAAHAGVVSQGKTVRSLPGSIAAAALWERFAALFAPARVATAFAALLLVALSASTFVLWGRQNRDGHQIARLNEQLTERERALVSAQESLDEARRQLGQLEGAARQQAEQVKPSGTPAAQAPAAPDRNEVERLRRDLKGLAQPQLDSSIVDLDPAPVRGGADATSAGIEIPRNASLLTLILNFTGETYPAYEVEILDQQGQRVWRGRKGRTGEAHSLNLTLQRRLIPDGRFRIKLYGLEDGRRQLIADYPLLVRYR